MPSSGARSELRLILLPNECARGSQQGNEWASSARTQPQRSERFTVGSGEAAHLFRRLGARTLKMLSVKRGRAGRLDLGLDVGGLPISSALDRHTGERILAHSTGRTGVPKFLAALSDSGRARWGALQSKAHSSARADWCEPTITTGTAMAQRRLESTSGMRGSIGEVRDRCSPAAGEVAYDHD